MPRNFCNRSEKMVNKMQDLFSLKNKVVVVTGGAGYLGAAMTEAFLNYGAKVYIASRKEDKEYLIRLQQQFLKQIEFIYLDVTDTVVVNTAIKKILNKESQIDVLVNNAYSGKTGELLNGLENDWLDSFNGSIHATYRVTKAVLPSMLERKEGSIINIASMYGLVSPNPEIYGQSMQNNPPQYGAAKAGIIQFTKYLAGHFASQGIRANCIAPGPFPNEKTQENHAFIEELKKKNPTNRIGQPKDLQGIAVLLASDASNYINGQTISVDGGWTIW